MSLPLPVLSPFRRSRLPLWIGLGILLPVLVSLGTAAFLVSRGVRVADDWMQQAKTLTAEREGAIRQNIPLEPKDLKRVPPVPRRQNAALLYRQIYTIYNRDTEAKRSTEGASLSQFMKQETRNSNRKAVLIVLVRGQKMLRLAEQATTLAVCDFDRPWQQGPNTLIPELPAMRHVARLFAARAILHKESGNPAAALRDVAFGAQVGVHAGQDPCLISFLVRVAIQTIMHRPFIEILQQYGDKAEVLRLAEKTQLSFGARPNLRDAFRGEVVMERVMMNSVRDTSAPIPDWLKEANPPTALLNESGRVILADAWESRLLAYWRQVDSGVKAAHGNLHNAQNAWSEITKKESALAGQPGYEMNGVLLPLFDSVPKKTMPIEANYQLRSQMIALLKSKIKTRNFPSNLESLPKEQRFFDPFNNEPLIYHKNKEGFVLYSVSANGTDDGGAETRDKDKYLLDIVVRYP